MKVSLNWVRRYVDLSGITPEEIAQKLTFAGIEVEGIEHLASGTNLVTGHVLDAKLMENSDHLTICQVDMGAKYGTVQIVCGAPNIGKGQNVIVARPGAVLPQVTITKSTIRGHESNGMICSLLELGVAAKTLSQASIEGIEVLDAAIKPGHEDVLALLGLDDTILLLKVLANRPDALAVYNLARELALLFERPLRDWKVPLVTGHKPEFTVEVKTPKCPQFTIRTLKGIGKGKTPEYMVQSLKAMGMRPISPLVDISNYVMLLTGQPLHIYDIDRLEEQKLVISDDIMAPFFALDDKEYPVQRGDIVIKSGHTIACLAGIMGSNATGVKDATSNIAIEAANFHGTSIRQTSIRLNLPSESSQRFIKGINPHQAEDVLDLTIHLIKEILGCATYSSSVSVDTIDHKLKKIAFTLDDINHKLGTSFTATEVEETLTKLGFAIVAGPSSWHALVPAHRIDIDGAADLAEEVIRIRGFEHIKVELPFLQALHPGLTVTQRRQEGVRRLLRDRGLDEILTYTLLQKDESDRFRFLNHDEVFRIGNPMTDEHEFVRASILYSMLKVANFNVARQNKNLALFEISGVETTKNRTLNLGVVLVGNKSLRNHLTTKPYDFFDMKGLFEALMAQLGIDQGRYRYERLNNRASELHPGQSATIIIENQLVGLIGTLSPEAEHQFDFKKAPVIMMELDLGHILSLRISAIKMTPPSKFPTMTRDLAIVVNRDIDAATVIKLIRKTQKDVIRQVDIFDVYMGSHIPSDKKSLAVSIALSSDKKTLTDAECLEVIEKIKVALASAINASFRV